MGGFYRCKFYLRISVKMAHLESRSICGGHKALSFQFLYRCGNQSISGLQKLSNKARRKQSQDSCQGCCCLGATCTADIERLCLGMSSSQLAEEGKPRERSIWLQDRWHPPKHRGSPSIQGMLLQHQDLSGGWFNTAREQEKKTKVWESSNFPSK